MRILIIEDEEPAGERLKKMILEIIPDATIPEQIVSIKSAVAYLSQNPPPDLILMDIHLADGNSFEIFEMTVVNAPVIFTTAYDEYAIKAFKVNSVEYLMKPVKKEELAGAIEKYRKYHEKKEAAPDLTKLLESFRDLKQGFKKRFLIRYGEHIKAVEIDDVAYFYTEDKINFLKTKDNHTYHVDYNLDRLEQILDPEKFFRINRQFIIGIDSIDQMFSFSKSRVKVNLKPPINMDTIVSTERSPFFKEWLGGKE
ncbi:MAG: LytTR family DNA-binding domain-containing protein [Bacteroidia bacterium]